MEKSILDPQPASSNIGLQSIRAIFQTRLPVGPTGAHWNLPGHTLANLKVTVLEQSKSRDKEYIREHENYFIKKFDTFNDGINREW